LGIETLATVHFIFLRPSPILGRAGSRAFATFARYRTSGQPHKDRHDGQVDQKRRNAFADLTLPYGRVLHDYRQAAVATPAAEVSRG
jgi:hypothetical protein